LLGANILPVDCRAQLTCFGWHIKHKTQQHGLHQTRNEIRNNMKPAFKILNPKNHKVEPEHQEAMLFPNVQEIKSLQ
jgi:hypothetical protein